MDSSSKLPGFDWDRLQDLVAGRTDKPPTNSVTAYDVANKTGFNINTVLTMLRGKVSAGIMKKGVFWDDVRKRRMAYYWFADGVEAKEKPAKSK